MADSSNKKTNQDSDKKTIFSKIIDRELPATIRYEDDEFIAIDDINPAAPVHILVIPKLPYATLEDVEATNTDFHAKILQVARITAKQMNISNNYKLFMNVGLKVQDVPHIHLHVTGGWDKKLTKDELRKASKKISRL